MIVNSDHYKGSSQERLLEKLITGNHNNIKFIEFRVERERMAIKKPYGNIEYCIQQTDFCLKNQEVEVHCSLMLLLLTNDGCCVIKTIVGREETTPTIKHKKILIARKQFQKCNFSIYNHSRSSLVVVEAESKTAVNTNHGHI